MLGLVWLAIGVLGAVSGAADPEIATAGPAAPWTVEDVIALESSGGFEISPDGRWVVWEKRRPDLKKNRQLTEIHLTSLQDGADIRLTRGGEGDGSPRWSPDGKRIAFRSDRHGEDAEDEADEDEPEEGSKPADDRRTQVWLMDARGGEPWPVTSFEKGIESFAWLDAGTLVVTAREDATLRERKLAKAKDDAQVVEDEQHVIPVRLFTVEAASRRVRRRSENDDRIVELAAAPDGRWAVARHHVGPHYDADARARPRFFLYDMRSEGIAPRREIFTEPLFFPYGFIWARDGSGFYCLRTRTSEPGSNGAGIETLFWFDLASGAHREVPLDWANGVGGLVGYDVTSDGFVALLADGPANRLAIYRRAGDAWNREMIDDPKADRVQSFKVGPDGAAFVFTHSTASMPGRTFAGRLAGARIEAQRPIAPINEALDGKPMARTEVARWKGAQGDEVSGILFYPGGYVEGKRYPLVLMIHGGPFAVDLDAFDESWAYAAHLVAGRGAFVLKPNYHGSSNHGQAFAESIKGRYYEHEIRDILDGIDALDGRGLIDTRRLGVIGWSNGAILTWDLITRTDRFRAAAPGAGDVNWTGDYGNCEFGAWFGNYYMGGPPWEKAKTYIEKSPYFRLGAVKTPTLIFFGTEDRAVDTGQGWEAYRALQQIGRAPVRFILFPGEPHVLSKPSHQRRKLEEEMAWFDRYLFDRPAVADEAILENSPLDLLMKGRAAARDGPRLGVLREGLLVPETVLWRRAPGGPLQVGRFEVTRAQFAAFEPSYPVGEGAGNLPATRITFDQASAYCAWLSQRTGMSFRLPTAAELRQLMAAVDDDPLAEVTLDHWAGRKLNPDDARALAAALGGLDGPGRLLRPAGSARPVDLSGDPGRSGSPAGLVYDLGGNAAEWAADGGIGRALGCNASQACDPRAAGVEPPAEYTGFRIVRSSKDTP